MFQASLTALPGSGSGMRAASSDRARAVVGTGIGGVCEAVVAEAKGVGYGWCAPALLPYGFCSCEDEATTPSCTGPVDIMWHRKWRETKQQLI